MNKIISKQQLSDKIFLFEIEAPLVTKNCKAGNFVILRTSDKGTRFPLAITDFNKEKGTITVVAKKKSVATNKLCSLNEGENITDVVGPLGNPAKIENYGSVLCIGQGVHIATMLPILKELKNAGNKTTTLLLGCSQNCIILQDEVKKYSDNLIIVSKDGSCGIKGIPPEEVVKTINEVKPNHIFAAAKAHLMQKASETAMQINIPIDVCLNAIMVDGMGMCGACRLEIDGKTKFTCTDGPIFDGTKVNWQEVIQKNNAQEEAEKELLQKQYANPSDQEQKLEPYSVTMDVEPTKETFEELINRDSEWRKELRAKYKNPERTKMPRTPKPALDPEYRATTMTAEVIGSFTKEMAIKEAHRCLDCPNPQCMQGCPVHNNIPSFIKNIERGQFLAAMKVLRNTTNLPAICGRVCDQSKQCEGHCIHNKMKSQPVAIGMLERFVADYERETKNNKLITAPNNGIKIAAIGSGPASLCFAGDMAKAGFDVYVFEALHEIGGVLKYGIPEYRLPNRLVEAEIDRLKQAGVHFQTDCWIGKTLTFDDLKAQGFKGFFVGTGAGYSNFMHIPGENAIGVVSANEYLTKVNLLGAANNKTETPISHAKHVIVVGGGNTAMDSCRTAKRLGANVTVVYRRSEAEMPAGIEEVKEAKEEGVKFMNLHNPIKYLTDDNGKVKQAVLQVMELGEPDESGRRSPVPVEGKTVTIDADEVIVAVGVIPNNVVSRAIPGLELGRKDVIIVNENQQSNLSDVYAGGDITRGGATVVLAMRDGKLAAKNMIAQLQK